MTPTQWLQAAIEHYGYIVVFLAVAIESMGVPFPGETALIAGAVYAGTGGRLSIGGVIAAAAIGAIAGDNLGYTIGRRYGYELLRQIAGRLHLNERHLAHARSFFARHGDKTVFFGRFFSILRTWAAFLAGVNHMPRRSFFFWNALGGIVWALVYGTLGYLLGNNLPLLRRIQRIMGFGGTILLIATILFIVVCWYLWRRGLLRYAWLDATWARLGGWLAAPNPGGETTDGAGGANGTQTSESVGEAVRPPANRRRRRLPGSERLRRRASPAPTLRPQPSPTSRPRLGIDPHDANGYASAPPPIHDQGPEPERHDQAPEVQTGPEPRQP